MAASYVISTSQEHSEALCTQGELYSFTAELTIAAGASALIGFTSTLNCAFIVSRWRTGADKMRSYLHENIAYTGGTVKAPVCRNRQNPKTAQTVWKTGVTATPPAPVSAATLFGLKGGGAAEFTEELILKKNTPYLIEIANDANSQQDTAYVYVAFCEYDLPS